MLTSLKINILDFESNLATCSLSIQTDTTATSHIKCLLNTHLAGVLQTKFQVTKERHRNKWHKYAIPFSNANVHCL